MSKNNIQLKYKTAVYKRNKKTAGKTIFTNGKEYAVAVYIRVANGDTRQASLFELQRKYYTDFISSQENWRLVVIYSDFGVSRLSGNREQFNKMIEDCVNGARGVNLIVVKSISRFLWDISELMEAINKLARLTPPVGIYFETLDEKGLSYINPLCPFTWHRSKYK